MGKKVWICEAVALYMKAHESQRRWLRAVVKESKHCLKHETNEHQVTFGCGYQDTSYEEQQSFSRMLLWVVPISVLLWWLILVAQKPIWRFFLDITT